MASSSSHRRPCADRRCVRWIAEVVEAAEASGARPSEVLFGVRLPLASMAGGEPVIMLTLSMVVIAGLPGRWVGRDRRERRDAIQQRTGC